MKRKKVTEIEVYNCQDVMKILNCKQATAYRVIKDLRQELQNDGYMAPIAGKIPKSYFDKRFGI